MNEKNYILEYYQKIKDGRITVGKWIVLVYEYIVQGLENKAFYFDQKKANHAVNWIEAHMHHSEGDLAPDNLKLELWQKAMISAIFGLVDADGIRVHREIFIVMARKNGKSLLAASIMAYCIYADNEYGAKAYCLAPKVEQADIVFDAFWQSVELDKELSAITKSRKTDKYVKKYNASVKKVAMNIKASDGYNPHCAVLDELAAWPANKSLRQYEVMTSALGARKQPLIIGITTSGYENDGIYDELMKRATRLLLGDSKEKRFLPFLYMIDDIDKWDDINELQKANPNMGVSVSVDFLLEGIAKAENSLSSKAEFLTKNCCIKQNSSAAWLSAEDVAKCFGAPLRLEDFAHNYCVAGIDLSQSVDLTACVILIEKDGILNCFAKFWMPAEKLEEATERDGIPYNIYLQKGFLELSGENYVNYEDVYNYLTMLVEQYEILPLMVGYDRYSSQILCGGNGLLSKYGFKLDDVYQGDNLHPIIQRCEGLIKDGKINIGDNDLAKIHLLNSAVKHNTQRNRGRLVKISPTARIDFTAALLDALTMIDKYSDEIGEQLKNED